MTLPLPMVLYVAVALVCVGLFGAVARRDPVAALTSVGVMAAGVVLQLAAYSRFVAHARTTAQVAALFVIAIAAAQIATGLAIVMRLRSRASRTGEGDAS